MSATAFTPPAAFAASDPSPPRPPATRAEGIRLVGGLVVVCAGLLVITVLTCVAMVLVQKQGAQVVALATTSFGVSGTIVGAYFGVKMGSDGTNAALAGLRDESAKVQSMAAHLPPDEFQQALQEAGRSR